uniref:Transcription factor CBF/NF-Y/archaeal histone domain-containing protein n=1 Tax=Cannabis sativa TaxID=3483 RepID=A0A803NYL4_CANSA
MERGAFHGYRKISNASSGTKLSEINGSRVNEISNTQSSADENECTVREQDRFMPIANVIRIMRKILPPHAKISDDAKETIQECVSEYISFITGEANERCQREQRKTITAEDVLWAMISSPFMKRLGSLDYSALAATGFAPNTAPFHNGFFGYFKDATGSTTASGAGARASTVVVVVFIYFCLWLFLLVLDYISKSRLFN